MRIVVTGSSGLVGSRLARRFKERGQTVVGAGLEPGTPSVVDQFVRGDFTREPIRQQALEGADTIVHLAAAKNDWGIDDDTLCFFENLEVYCNVLKKNQRRSAGTAANPTA